MKRVILLCLLVGLALPGIPHSTAQDNSESPAPYLYYFSEDEPPDEFPANMSATTYNARYEITATPSATFS